MAPTKQSRPKAPSCPPRGHADAPHGPKGPCPWCGKRRCHGKASTGTGRCRAFPIRGGVVCVTHGGRAGQVKRKAAERRAQAAQVAAAARWAAPIETTAADAMREVLWALKGLREHYARQLDAAGAASSPPGEWDERTKALVVLYEQTERDYFRVAAECRRANIDEARYELEAGTFELVDRLLSGVFRRVGMDPNSPEVAGHVAAELRLIAGGKAS